MEKTFNKSEKILLVNETIIIDHSVHNDWLDFFTNKLIPTIKESGLAKDVVFSKIKGDFNPDGITYALQVKIKQEELESYKTHTGISENRTQLNSNFKNKFGAFETVLEVILD